MSPQFKYLPEIIIPTECNLNGKCESNMGENSNNCSDCKKSWFWTAIFWIVILLAIAFVAYIILQEWYKRHYESSLFKDKNQLFNIINYMNNCELHQVTKPEIYKQLRGMQWRDEQIFYAWNKLHGLRTGMWEIPLFKSYEHNKLKEELKKRQMVGENIPQRTIGSTNKPIYPTRIQPRFPIRPSPKVIERSLIRDPTKKGQTRDFTRR